MRILIPRKRETSGTVGGRPTRRSAVAGKLRAILFCDFHATMRFLLGMEHTRLTYRYNVRNFRLTDVEREVVKAIQA
jgi:hypothetical protein